MSNAWSRAFQTAQRKLTKSVRQRGVWGTFRRTSAMPFQYVRGFLRSQSPTIRRLREVDQEWDTFHKVDTCLDKDAGWMSEITSLNWVFGRGYHPAPTASLRSVLQDLDIDYRDFTFIDLGSGKGRSLFVAADFPFQAIVGVEYSERLHRIASENFKTYESPTQQSRNLTSIHLDAAAYELPKTPLVLYLYDPFGEPVMQQVVDRIHASLREQPRPIYVVYFNPVFAEMFESEQCFQRLTQGEEFERYWSRSRHDRDANEFTSEALDAQRYVVYGDVVSVQASVAGRLRQESSCND